MTATRTASVHAQLRDGKVLVEGEPIVYDTRYSVTDIFGVFSERMARRCATPALGRCDFDCRFLINHDGVTLARTPGTLELWDADDALHMRAWLDPGVTLAADLLRLIESRAISQMSVGFTVERDSWDEALENRVIYSLDRLLDTSAVSFPASPTTSIVVCRAADPAAQRRRRSALAERELLRLKHPSTTERRDVTRRKQEAAAELAELKSGRSAEVRKAAAERRKALGALMAKGRTYREAVAHRTGSDKPERRTVGS